jgi:hypothetical protein
LIDPTPFHLNIAPTTATLAYPIKFNPERVIVPYTLEEKSTIDAKFSMVKNYFKTWKNIYPACYEMHNTHVNVVPMEITFMDNGGNIFMLCEFIDYMN